jgi:hypothetical protein
MDMSGIGSAARRAAAFWRVAPALLAVVALGACGKSTTGPDNPTRTVIGNQSGTLAPLAAQAFTVQASVSGTIDATVDWGNGSNDFDVFVTANSCNAGSLVDLASCNHITSAESANLKPERVTWPGSANTTYKIWIVNFGVSTDSFTLNAGITN